MKATQNNWATILLIAVILAATGYHCSTGRKTTGNEDMQVISTNLQGQGMDIRLQFRKGETHNHPLMAIWVEDTAGNYIETLFVAESIGKGVFRHGDRSQGFWQEGPIRRPAALPYWAHQRGIKADDGLYMPTPENPVPDAVTGPTPPGNFQLNSKTSQTLPSVFVILLEINQSWDWNPYWTNNKFPDDEHYKTSSQPSLVYATRIDRNAEDTRYMMEPVGHGHPSGTDGSLNKDLSTLTTALDIVKSAEVIIGAQDEN